MKKLIFPIVLCILFALCACTNTPTSPSSQAEGGSPAPAEATSPADQLAEALSIEKEKASAAIDWLTSAGVDGIHTIQPADGAELPIRVLSRIDPLLIALDESGQIRSVQFDLTSAYLCQNGESIAKLLSAEDEMKLQRRCEELMTDYLLSPGSAEYPERAEWNIVQIDDVVHLTSFVLSENFSEEIVRKDFVIRLKDGEPVSVIVDGQEKMN